MESFYLYYEVFKGHLFFNSVIRLSGVNERELLLIPENTITKQYRLITNGNYYLSVPFSRELIPYYSECNNYNKH